MLIHFSKNLQKTKFRALVKRFSLVCMESLNTLRIKKFKEKVSKSVSTVQIKTLPPTSDARKYHSFRVCKGDDLRPDDWGWRQEHGKLMPRTMDCSPAPECILKVIRCQCLGTCETKKCSCRKNGLLCTYACGECKGIDCRNVSESAYDDLEADELFQ